MQAQYHSGTPVTCQYTAPGAISAGDVVVFASSLTRVSRYDIASGDKGTLDCGGALYYLPYSDNDIANGDAIWFDDTNNIVTDAATSGDGFFGYAVEDAGASKTGYVLCHHQAYHAI